MSRSVGRAAGQADLDLAPVHLGLLSRPGFEAALGQRGKRCSRPQGPYCLFYRIVAAQESLLGHQLLIEDARRVVDLGSPRSQPSLVGRSRVWVDGERRYGTHSGRLRQVLTVLRSRSSWRAMAAMLWPASRRRQISSRRSLPTTSASVS